MLAVGPGLVAPGGVYRTDVAETIVLDTNARGDILPSSCVRAENPLRCSRGSFSFFCRTWARSPTKMKHCRETAAQAARATLGPQRAAAEEVWFTVEFHDLPSGAMLTRVTMNGETLPGSEIELPGGLNEVEKQLLGQLILARMGVIPTGPGHVEIFQRGGRGGKRRRGLGRR
jgi:hypothetical protein